MPEAGRHASILIATSWQALNRALTEGPETRICNCTVVTLFAGFYIEAHLNQIVERLHLTSSLEQFTDKRHPGLQDKLAWFYNEFVARKKAANLKKAFKSGMARTLRRRFPGFAKLYRFRNDLAHGIVNKSAHSLSETQQLRQQAKDIVRELSTILQKHGYPPLKTTSYYEAIGLKLVGLMPVGLKPVVATTTVP